MVFSFTNSAMLKSLLFRTCAQPLHLVSKPKNSASTSGTTMGIASCAARVAQSTAQITSVATWVLLPKTIKSTSTVERTIFRLTLSAKTKIPQTPAKIKRIKTSTTFGSIKRYLMQLIRWLKMFILKWRGSRRGFVPLTGLMASLQRFLMDSL